MLKGQEEIFEQLKNEIKSDSFNSVITIRGNSGIGKTYIMEKLIDEFCDKSDMSICYIKGDQFCQNRDYYCIKQSLSEISFSYDKMKYDKNLISEFVSEIPKVGDISKIIVSDKLNYSEVEQSRRTFYLDNEDERNIVYRLNYLMENKHAVIICDNFQFFDIKTLQLIYIFLQNKSVFNFMNSCQFLMVITKDVTYNSYIDTIVDNFSTAEYTLKPLSFQDFNVFYSKFAINKKIDDKIKRVLFNLSNGHLEVIKQVAFQIKQSEITMDSEDDNLEIYLGKLINQNFINLGDSGKEIAQLLEYASLIGKVFLNYELESTSCLPKQNYMNAINYSKKMNYIIAGMNYTCFSHDIIQLVFRNRAYNNNISYYEKMRECVKELFPGDYVRRIHIAIQLRDYEEAAILIVLYYFKWNFKINVSDEHIMILDNESNINNFFLDIKIASKYYNKRNYKKTIEILNEISDIYPIQLLAIRDVLKSISLTKLIDNEYRREAIKCLNSYSLENINGEGDLYLQILLSRISSYSHNGMIEEAKECEKQIYRYLQPRLKYDENAITTLYVLKRKSNALHECIIAEKKIQKSVNYFKPLPGNSIPLNPIQYIMSLGNHAGILIECGRFRDSIEETKKAYELIHLNPTVIFPRLQIIDNNFLIALYLENSSLKETILHSYKKIINLSENADNIFITSNYSSLLAINGYIEDAYNMLLRYRDKAKANNEMFYEISIENNLLILELYNRNYNKSQEILDNLKSHINGVIDESYYRKRYELIQSVIDQKYVISIDKIDTFLFDFCSQFQDSWAYWGHSFDFTALYYWSDL